MKKDADAELTELGKASQREQELQDQIEKIGKQITDARANGDGNLLLSLMDQKEKLEAELAEPTSSRGSTSESRGTTNRQSDESDGGGSVAQVLLATAAAKDASLAEKGAALAAALAEMEQLRALMPLPVPAPLDMQSSSAVFSRVVHETGTTGFAVAWGDFERAFASLYLGAVSSSPDVAVIARLRADMDANGDGFINRAEWAHWHQRWMAAGAPPMAEYIGKPE